MIPAALRDAAIVRLDECASTNDECWERAARGAREGTVVVARAQTAGRGRWGRAWTSTPGKDLLFSVLIAPPADGRLLPAIPLAGALAVADALDALRVPDLGLRWPNDVLAAGRKIAGALAEHRASPPAVVLGIGINVVSGPADWPPEIRGAAASCAWLGIAATPEALLPAILDRLAGRLEELADRPAAFERAWEERSALAGRDVEITLPTLTAIRGRVERLSVLEGIALRLRDGSRRALQPGEVERIR